MEMKASLKPVKMEREIKEELGNSFEAIYTKREQDFEDELAVINRDQEVCEERRRTVKFAVQVLERLAFKGGVAFYASAIRAILRTPKVPLSSLRDFSLLIKNDHPRAPLKFAMIGDRQKKDIEPPMKLLKRDHLLAFRLLSGQYSQKERPEDAGENAPTYLADTLAQIKALLLSRSIWSKVECVYDPPVFLWKIDFDNVDQIPEDKDIQNTENVYLHVGSRIILCGIQMSPHCFPLTNMLCRRILQEHLQESKNLRADIKHILRIADCYSGESKPSRISEASEARRAARLLTALALDFGLKSEYSEEMEAFETQLRYCRSVLDKQEQRPPEMQAIDDAMQVLAKIH